MQLAIILAATFYVTGAIAVFALHTQMPVTFGLAVLRSALWPLWVTTGRPHGEPLMMDQYPDPD